MNKYMVCFRNKICEYIVRIYAFSWPTNIPSNGRVYTSGTFLFNLLFEINIPEELFHNILFNNYRNIISKKMRYKILIFSDKNNRKFERLIKYDLTLQNIY